MKTNIIVNLQYEATHWWDDCNIVEVDFLKNEHRHIFHICCKMEVFHDDRQVEIILLKRKVIKYLKEYYDGTFYGNSCETIAKQIMEEFNLNYCSVLEDNENGAEVIK